MPSHSFGSFESQVMFDTAWNGVFGHFNDVDDDNVHEWVDQNRYKIEFDI